MRILLLTHYYPPEIGAASRRLSGLVARWAERGIEVIVVTSLPHYPRGRLLSGWSFGRSFRAETGEYGECVIRVPFFPVAGRGVAKLLDHLFVAACAAVAGCIGRRTRADVVVASIPSVPMMGSALLVNRLRRIPVIFDMRDPWPDSLIDSRVLPRPLARSVAAIVTWAQRAADAIVCVPAGFPARLRERGIAEKRIHFVPNGVDVRHIPRLPAPPAQRHRLRVLYLGTVGRAHNLKMMVDVLAELGPEKVEGRIIGYGTELRSVTEYARTVHAPVSFHPPVRGDALWEAYEWADTCLVSVADWPSLEYIVPAKLYEIMACGRHVTAAVSGAAEEVVRESGGGILVKPGDMVQLKEVLSRLQRERHGLDVGDSPRQWVSEHADSVLLADRFLTVIESLVQNS